ncbi:hypothetical protein JX266_010750 [Neoarthrinium moseri]|nr:hypothetical protein JX266_010750 [Neoarthrinium moseri]
MAENTTCPTQVGKNALSSISLFKRRFKGWRRAAIINTCLVSILLLTLSIVLVIAYAKSEEDGQVAVIFTAACGTERTEKVLNSPTRPELDVAHSKGSWLDIGVPSARNAFRVSRIRTIYWVFFFLSSVPIHLFFNSAVFAVGNRGTRYKRAIAAEPFLYGSAGYWPGATVLNYEENEYRNESENQQFFQDEAQEGSRRVSEMQAQFSQWKMIDVDTCKTLYFSGAGIYTYRDVILVDKPAGWIHSEIRDLSPNASAFLDHILPAKEPNFLFDYTGYCSVHAQHVYDQYNHHYTALLEVRNTCAEQSTLQHDSVTGLWTFTLFSNETTIAAGVRPAFQKQFNENIVKYCLAEPNAKAVLCLFVLKTRDTHPLVTLGDAIESHICDPSTLTRAPSSIIWNIQPKRRLNPVPTSVWLSSYALFTLGIAAIIYIMHLNQLSAGGLNVKQEGVNNDSDMPFEAFVAAAYSSWSLVVLLVLSCTLICIPIAIGLFRLPENSIIVGSNSFAIAASCHVSPLSQADCKATDDAVLETGSEGLAYSRISGDGFAPVADNASKELLTQVSQCELKLGVVSVPAGWPLNDSDDLEEDAPSVGHISFGTKMDDVSVPELGKLYDKYRFGLE